MNKMFEKRCNNEADHPWRIVMRSDDSYDSGKILSWCPVCGCIVIDHTVDGRIVEGGVIQTTELAVEASNNV